VEIRNKSVTTTRKITKIQKAYFIFGRFGAFLLQSEYDVVEIGLELAVLTSQIDFGLKILIKEIVNLNFLD
jgi:hypothetical protein